VTGTAALFGVSGVGYPHYPWCELAALSPSEHYSRSNTFPLYTRINSVGDERVVATTGTLYAPPGWHIGMLCGVSNPNYSNFIIEANGVNLQATQVARATVVAPPTLSAPSQQPGPRPRLRFTPPNPKRPQ
jgi:hypothetical protein